MKLVEAGRDPPPQLYQQPEIAPWHEWYWLAFHELSSERQIGMSMGPIPRSAARDYGIEHGLAGDELDRFLGIIRAVDAEYLFICHKQKPERDIEIASTDAEGMRTMMTRLQARASSATKPTTKPAKKAGNGHS